MALGGAGPLHSRLDLNQFHGRTEEGFHDYGQTRKADTTRLEPQQPQFRGQHQQYFNPTERIEQVHGEESYGLGTSTFLEGAPASKRALERRESEEQTAQQEITMGGGLQRKKSLAQRFRGMSNSRPRNPHGEVFSPDARYYNNVTSPSENTPVASKSVSAGGPARAVYTRENEINPFDNEYDQAFDRKGAEIKFVEQEKPNAVLTQAPSSPRGNGLTRSVTADAAARSPTEEEKSNGGGFLNRMKSLKGGRRARPERKDSTSRVAE